MINVPGSGPANPMSEPKADPAVTIVMANYNGARYIEAALKSALAQSLRDIEVIVADDASTDDSADRVAAIAARDARVRLLRASANGGPAAARNLCLEAARGRWIAVMDSDDLMHPERLEQLVMAAEADDAEIVADDLLIFDDNSAVAPSTCLSDRSAAAAFWIDAADYVRANVLFSGAEALGYMKPLVRTSVIHESGVRYDTTLRIAEDYDFVVRLLVLGARFRVYPRLLYFYRKHGQSISHRLSRRTLEPMLAAHDRLRAAIGAGDRRLDSAMAIRRASLQRALDFEDLVEALKRRNWRDGLAKAMSRPRVAALLRGPLVDRIHRFGAGQPPEPRAAERRVCVISRQRNVGSVNSGSSWLIGLCTAVSQSGCEVHLLCPSPAVFDRLPAMRLRSEMRVFRSIRVRGSIRVGPLLVATDPATVRRALVGLFRTAAAWLGVGARRLDEPAPHAAGQSWTRRDLLFVARNARFHADVVIVDDATLTDVIPYTLRPDAITFAVLRDLFSADLTRCDGRDAADPITAIGQQAEMALLAKAGAVIAIQAKDAAIVRRCLPGRHVIVAPMAVTPVPEPRPGRGNSILCVGSDAMPDVRGLRWFLEMIWPDVRSAVPDAALRVAGSIGGAAGPPPNGVQFLGAVRDLAPLYQDAAVVIAPARAGSGQTIRTIEALGHGKAIVATSATLQSVGTAASGAIWVADEPADFAAAVIGLLRDEELRMTRARAALELARTRFSARACYAGVLALMSSPRPHGSGATL